MNKPTQPARDDSAEPDVPTTAGGTIYGYARVSSADQNLARQLDALAQFPVEPARIFADKASGKDFNRPAYRRLMARLAPGDVLVVKSIDRLGRNYQEIINEWRHITQTLNAAIVVLDMPILDTRSKEGGLTGVFISDLILQLLSYVAQIERDNIKARQAEGIAAAKARGVACGRPKIDVPPAFASVAASFDAGQITRSEAARRLGISVSTFYRWRRVANVSLVPHPAQAQRPCGESAVSKHAC
jgi:DNA invertase Pin-like site-specific DNA recombinase